MAFSEELARTVEKEANIIAVLSEEAAVGRALELLLQSVGYRTRFLAEPPLDEASESLDGVQLLVLAPTVSEKLRENSLGSTTYMAAIAGKPVLELVTSSTSSRPLKRGRVLWPCRIEELQREIEAALLIGSENTTTPGEEHGTGPTDHEQEGTVETRTA